MCADRLSHQFVRCDGIVADALAGGVVNGVGHRGGGPGDADLTNPPRAQWIEFRIGNVEDGDIDAADVTVDGHMVFSEVFVDCAALHGVDVSLFVESE